MTGWRTDKRRREENGKKPNEECCDFLLFAINCSGNSVKTNYMGGACVTYGGGENAYRVSDGRN